MKQKQLEENPWELPEAKLKSEIEFLDQGISALRSISGEFETIITKKEEVLKALSESNE